MFYFATVFFVLFVFVFLLPLMAHTVVCVSTEYRNVTDGQTDTRTVRIAISISRVSVLTRDKNALSRQIFARVANQEFIKGRPTLPSSGICRALLVTYILQNWLYTGFCVSLIFCLNISKWIFCRSPAK